MAKLASSGGLIRRDGDRAFAPALVDTLMDDDLHACERFIKGRIETPSFGAEVR